MKRPRITRTNAKGRLEARFLQTDDESLKGIGPVAKHGLRAPAFIRVIRVIRGLPL
jgi:hypothetical protein